MATKLVPPDLDRLDEDTVPPAQSPKPDLKTAVRRPEPRIEGLVSQGFVTEASVAELPDPSDATEVLTIEIPRRLKRALQADVVARRDDPERRPVASMKSIILEALAANGYAALIRRADIEVQAGNFMKRQSAQLRKRS